MTDIKNLTQVNELSAGDLVPIYTTSNGATRKASAAAFVNAIGDSYVEQAEAQANAATLTVSAFQNLVYPGVYAVDPTTRPNGSAVQEGDRAVVLVGGLPTEKLRSGGLWIVPNVGAANLAAPTGASLVGFLQAGTGAAPQTQQDKDRQTVSVTDFYANGASGAIVDATGGLDSILGIQKAIDSLPAAGGVVEFPPGTFKISSAISIRSGIILRGHGSQNTVISYTGAAQALVQSTPGVRIFGVGLDGIRINDAGTGTVGLDLNSTSSSDFEDVVVNGFTTGVSLTGPNGFCVYNRFYNVTAQNSTTGYLIGSAGSNSNSFIACRVNIASSFGFDIVDSNQNAITHSQIEGAAVGVRITSSAPSLSDRNTISFNRFEGCTTNYDITSANVRETVAIANHAVNGASVDNGARSMLIDIFGLTGPNLLLQSTNTAASNGAFRFVRLSQGGASLPAMVVRDDAAGGGTPITLQIETERATGKFYSGKRGGTEFSYLDATGRLMLSGAAPIVAAGQIGFGATTAATVGAAGAATALPANPLGYLIVNLAGTNVKIPYYNS